MISATDITWVLTSYFVGCFTAGYYFVRWRTGEDIRAHGSGNVGAKNVGRRLGKAGFLITLLLDAGKGALAVRGAQYFLLDENAVVAAMAAVAIGHNWPVQLRFRGGKGVAVSLGALLAYEPFLILVLLGIFGPVFVLWRNFTLSGLLAFALAPLAAYVWDFPMMAVAALSVLAILLLIGHRKNLREEIARIFQSRSVKEQPSPPNKGAAS